MREGGVAGLALGNSPLFPAAFLALCRLDATVALLPPQYGRSELKAIADRVGLSSIVAEAEGGPRIAAAIPIASASTADGLRVLVPRVDARPVSRDEVLLKFSSGSTAEPKGIALSADNLLAEAENVTTTLELGPGDRILSGVPLFHSYGFDLGVLPTLYSGTTLLLEDAFVPRRTLRRLAYRVAAFLGVPAQYRAFLTTQLDKLPDLSEVRWLLSCTAPLAPETVTEFMDRFGAPICQHYGSSETGAVTTHLPSEVAARPASVGRPMSGVEVSLVEDGRPVPPGSEGEVVVTSGAVARGYALGAPDGPSPLGDGIFRTGDIGRLDCRRLPDAGRPPRRDDQRRRTEGLARRGRRRRSSVTRRSQRPPFSGSRTDATRRSSTPSFRSRSRSARSSSSRSAVTTSRSTRCRAASRFETSCRERRAARCAWESMISDA